MSEDRLASSESAVRSTLEHAALSLPQQQRPIDVQSTPVDTVVTCGYKWLRGPTPPDSPGFTLRSRTGYALSRPTG
jgi:hypothetical protein